VNGTFASVVAIASVLALGLGGCASQAEKPELAEAPATRSTGSYGAGTAGVQQESYADRPWDDPSSPLYRKVIYFDYDSSEIRSEFVPLLQTHAGYLANHPGTRVTLEGHTDERGTREYNLALAQRRAASARDFLVSLGIDASRLQIVSYGKERPFCTGQTEDCWQKNRRAHFVVTAK